MNISPIEQDRKLIVNDWPPNIAAIRKVLPVTANNIFAYAGTIYSPGSDRLEPALIAHERVHFAQQQQIGVDVWWQKFLADPKFRLAQEIPAHQAEWQHFLSAGPSRAHRRLRLKHMSKRLSASMYGHLLTVAEAKKAILA